MSTHISTSGLGYHRSQISISGEHTQGGMAIQCAMTNLHIRRYQAVQQLDNDLSPLAVCSNCQDEPAALDRSRKRFSDWSNFNFVTFLNFSQVGFFQLISPLATCHLFSSLLWGKKMLLPLLQILLLQFLLSEILHKLLDDLLLCDANLLHCVGCFRGG